MKICSFLLGAAILFAGCSKSGKTIEKKCQFPFAVPSFTLSGSTEPIDQNYDFEKVRCITEYSYGLTEFPKIISKTESYTPISAAEAKSLGMEPVEKAYNEIQKYFFKNKAVPIEFTKDSVGFSAEYQLGKIAVNVDDALAILNDASYSNPIDVLKYVMAHELGHYVHEIATHDPVTGKAGYTLHGNVSIYTLGEANDAATPVGEQVGLVKNYRQHYYYSHAEVDVFATTVLTNNNFKGWDDVYKFIDKTVALDTKGEFTSTNDFKGRKNAIKKTVAAAGK